MLTTLHRFQTALKRDDAVEVGGITRGKVRSYMPAAEESAAAASGGVCGVGGGGAAAAPPAKKRGPPTLSVHVSPTAAVAISGGLGNEFIPTELRELITKGVVTWHPGMRIGKEEEEQATSSLLFSLDLKSGGEGGGGSGHRQTMCSPCYATPHVIEQQGT